SQVRSLQDHARCPKEWSKSNAAHVDALDRLEPARRRPELHDLEGLPRRRNEAIDETDLESAAQFDITYNDDLIVLGTRGNSADLDRQRSNGVTPSRRRVAIVDNARIAVGYLQIAIDRDLAR